MKKDLKKSDFISISDLRKFKLWKKIRPKRLPVQMDIEVTARCNNNCNHCYINLPANSASDKSKELTINEIEQIAEDALTLGTIWCLITGGEPLLRKDFSAIYMMLKNKGFLVSVFTNACLITEKHIKLFKKYPPRDIEVTVYGLSKETYEKVSMVPGSFKAFQNGIKLLKQNAIPIRFKYMVMKSNIHEADQIGEFCRENTKDFYRFDPVLHLRYDGNKERNKLIKSERLSPEEIVYLEQKDLIRKEVLTKQCNLLVGKKYKGIINNKLIKCTAGHNKFTVAYDGTFKLCPALCHEATLYNLKTGSLADAWNRFVPKVKKLTIENPDYLNKCQHCSLINLCLNCPAHAHLETGKLDEPVDYFCKVAHARADAILKQKESAN